MYLNQLAGLKWILPIVYEFNRLVHIDRWCGSNGGREPSNVDKLPPNMVKLIIKTERLKCPQNRNNMSMRSSIDWNKLESISIWMSVDIFVSFTSAATAVASSSRQFFSSTFRPLLTVLFFERDMNMHVVCHVCACVWTHQTYSNSSPNRLVTSSLVFHFVSWTLIRSSLLHTFAALHLSIRFVRFHFIQFVICSVLFNFVFFRSSSYLFPSMFCVY